MPTMEWYVPITILPGIGMLIMSTTNQMMTLSAEIGDLLEVRRSPFRHNISHLKIHQLNRLTKAAALLYVSAACFVLSGIIGAVVAVVAYQKASFYILLLGVVLVLVALGILINYGFHAISIRRKQHAHSHHEHVDA